MKALTWHGKRDVRVDNVPDPTIEQPTDAIVRITSTGHLRLGPAPLRGARPVHGRGRHPRPRADGHRRGGRLRGHATSRRRPRRRSRSTSPAGTASCATTGLQSQCETTQVREQGMGAALFGYTKLYGQVPGGQAEYLRVPQAQYGPIKVPEGPPDERFLFLSDVLPTAWQAVEYADDSRGRHASPCSASARSARWRRGSPSTAAPGTVIGVDLVPERLARARRHGVETLDLDERRRRRRRRARADRRPRPGLGDRRGRHGGARRAGRQARAARSPACCPTRSRSKVMEKAGVDRLSALHAGDRRSSAAAARSRSPASTAARSTRCR